MHELWPGTPHMHELWAATRHMHKLWPATPHMHELWAATPHMHKLCVHLTPAKEGGWSKELRCCCETVRVSVLWKIVIAVLCKFQSRKKIYKKVCYMRDQAECI